MYNQQNIQELKALGDKAMAEMKNQISIFDATLQEALKGAPQQDKSQIEELKALCNSAINLAKTGKADAAQELIRNYEHGRKSNQ